MAMDTGRQAGEAVSQSPGADARPVILVLVEDTVGSLASLLLAAEIAAVQQGRVHVAHVSPPRVWWGAVAGMPVPPGLLAESDRAAAYELRDRVGDVLSLGAPVDWTFTWTRDLVHRAVARLVSELSPAAVVVGAPHRHRLPVRRPSLARWLIGRPNVQAVVVPA
jgi:nucleotide-binding universal stress UspA family protein